MTPLTDDERQLLDFEGQGWRYAGPKEEAIRQTFDCSPTTYYARLNHLLDQPAALEYKPVLVNRLRRIRDQRRHNRSLDSVAS